MHKITIKFEIDKPEQVFINCLRWRYSGNFLILSCGDPAEKVKDFIFNLEIIEEVIYEQIK